MSSKNKNKEEIENAEEQIKEVSHKINYYTSEFTIEVIMTNYTKKVFFIPDYQRNFTWDKDRQSKFIESILMDLPIPFLFFWQSEDTGKTEIIDGTQRIRTIEAFLDGTLILQNLDRLNLLNGFTFNDLPESRQLLFKSKSVRGIILQKDTTQQARFDLFERINTGSKIASPVEIRRGALPGAFIDMTIKLSEDEFIKSLLPVNKKREEEREREELITRFFAYSDGIDNYKNSPSNFIYAYVEKMNQELLGNNDLKQMYEERIKKIFTFVQKNFEHGFKKTKKAKSLPRVRFESLSLGVYEALKENPSLDPSKELINGLLNSKDFLKETRSDAANTRSRLLARINVTKKILLEG